MSFDLVMDFLFSEYDHHRRQPRGSGGADDGSSTLRKQQQTPLLPAAHRGRSRIWPIWRVPCRVLIRPCWMRKKADDFSSSSANHPRGRGQCAELGGLRIDFPNRDCRAFPSQFAADLLRRPADFPGPRPACARRSCIARRWKTLMAALILPVASRTGAATHRNAIFVLFQIESVARAWRTHACAAAMWSPTRRNAVHCCFRIGTNPAKRASFFIQQQGLPKSRRAQRLKLGRHVS